MGTASPSTSRASFCRGELRRLGTAKKAVSCWVCAAAICQAQLVAGGAPSCCLLLENGVESESVPGCGWGGAQVHELGPGWAGPRKSSSLGRPHTHLPFRCAHMALPSPRLPPSVSSRQSLLMVLFWLLPKMMHDSTHSEHCINSSVLAPA